MFTPYPKNVPYPERVFRIILGVILTIIAFAVEPLFGLPSLVWMGSLIFSAAFVIITGFYGWCPACALVGRKIKSQQSTQDS